LIDVCDADEAVNPPLSLLAVQTCGNASVKRGNRAFAASRHKVRPEGVCVPAGCLDSPVQRIGFDDLMTFML
jgi:hypothetical protein